MNHCEDFKRKAGETASFVADKGAEFARCALDKTVILGKMAAARSALALERDSLKKARVELGKAYYKKYGQNAEDEMSATCAQVADSLEKIAQHKKELAALKAQLMENPFAPDDEA